MLLTISIFKESLIDYPIGNTSIFWSNYFVSSYLEPPKEDQIDPFFFSALTSLFSLKNSFLYPFVKASITNVPVVYPTTSFLLS